MPHKTDSFVSGIVLAAGLGERMGEGGPKLLLPLGREPILARTVRNALASRLDEVLLLVGARHREVLEALAPVLSHEKLRVVRNARPERGRMSSVRAGLDQTEPRATSALFLCGDYPLVGPELIDRLLDLHEGGGYMVSLPVFGCEMGHPRVWRREAWPRLRALEGDEGTTGLVDLLGDGVGRLPLEDDSSQLDVDTREDYARLLERVGPVIEP